MTEQPPTPRTPLYVVGDVHGHRTELLEALIAAGLTDSDGGWTGDGARLWFLGDLVDRGPDGVAVIDLAMGLHAQAPDHVDLLLGNHEMLLLGMHRWGETEIDLSLGGTASFARSWLRNGGQVSDQTDVTAEQLAWLSTRPAAVVVDDSLLVHSDTLAYLHYGDSCAAISAEIQGVLAGDDPVAWWDIWRRLTTRYAFRGDEGPLAANTLLETLGGTRIVHGHSMIHDQLGIEPEEVEVPHEYCEGLVLNVDSGLCLGGPVPLVRIG